MREFHEVCGLFPLLEGEEFEELCEDIKEHGLLEAIWIDESGKIVDGRNRERACAKVEVEPRYRRWPEKGSLTSFVISLNLKRRHLTPSQKACIATESLPFYEAEAKARQRGGQGGVLLTEKIPEAKGEAREQAARVVGINPRYVSDAKKLQKEDPEGFESVKAGKVTLPEAKRALKKKKQKKAEDARRAEVGSEPGKIEKLDDERALGKIRCIYADPPWGYDDKGCDGSAEEQYPTMSLEDICALPVRDLVHKDDGAHLWMWTTWPMIREGTPQKVLNAWGMKWSGEIVWVKPGLGIGRWLRPSTEVLIFAVCEKRLKLLRNNQKGHLEAPRRGHSRKPEEFYKLIETLTPGPRVELFARQSKEGWFRWGNEA